MFMRLAYLTLGALTPRARKSAGGTASRQSGAFCGIDRTLLPIVGLQHLGLGQNDE